MLKMEIMMVRRREKRKASIFSEKNARE